LVCKIQCSLLISHKYKVVVDSDLTNYSLIKRFVYWLKFMNQLFMLQALCKTFWF